MEGRWMHALIALQGIRNVGFLIWEVQSIHAHKEEIDYGYNVITSDDSDEESELPKNRGGRALSHKELLYARDMERQYINHYLNK